MSKDRDFVDIAIVSQYLKCPICTNVLSSPYRIICGHTFCKKCILYWLNLKHQCPTCRAAAGTDFLQVDRIAAGLVSEIPLYCPKRDSNQCSWIGPQKEMKMHRKQCQIQTIQNSSQIALNDFFIDQSPELLYHKLSIEQLDEKPTYIELHQDPLYTEELVAIPNTETPEKRAKKSKKEHRKMQNFLAFEESNLKRRSERVARKRLHK